MDVKITVKNSENTEVNNVYQVEDKNNFSYTDSYGANNTIRIKDNTVSILRSVDTHKTFVHLENEDSYIKIFSPEGEFKFPVKVLAFIKESSIITIAYSLEETQNEICIKYIGE